MKNLNDSNFVLSFDESRALRGICFLFGAIQLILSPSFNAQISSSA